MTSLPPIKVLMTSLLSIKVQNDVTIVFKDVCSNETCNYDPQDNLNASDVNKVVSPMQLLSRNVLNDVTSMRHFNASLPCVTSMQHFHCVMSLPCVSSMRLFNATWYPFKIVRYTRTEYSFTTHSYVICIWKGFSKCPVWRHFRLSLHPSCLPKRLEFARVSCSGIISEVINCHYRRMQIGTMSFFMPDGILGSCFDFGQ